jgi:hypothetical protein
MSDRFWLTKAQLKRIESHFPRSRGVPRADDRVWSTGLFMSSGMVCDGEIRPRTTVPIRPYVSGSFAGPAWTSFIAS